MEFCKGDHLVTDEDIVRDVLDHIMTEVMKHFDRLREKQLNEMFVRSVLDAIVDDAVILSQIRHLQSLTNQKKKPVNRVQDQDNITNILVFYNMEHDDTRTNTYSKADIKTDRARRFAEFKQAMKREYYSSINMNKTSFTNMDVRTTPFTRDNVSTFRDSLVKSHEDGKPVTTNSEQNKPLFGMEAVNSGISELLVDLVRIESELVKMCGRGKQDMKAAARADCDADSDVKVEESFQSLQTKMGRNEKSTRKNGKRAKVGTRIARFFRRLFRRKSADDN